MLPHGNGFAPRGSVAMHSPPVKTYCKKSKLKSLFLTFSNNTLRAVLCLHLLKPCAPLSHSSVKCSFSRINVIPTFPSTCFPKHKSQKTNYSIHHSLPGTWTTISWGPFTSDALCSYKTVSKLRILKDCNETTTITITDRAVKGFSHLTDITVLEIVSEPNPTIACAKCTAYLERLQWDVHWWTESSFKKQKIYFSMHFFLQVSRHIS